MLSLNSMIGCLLRRSSSTPTGKPKRANGSACSATSTPICSGVACSKSTAHRGRASEVIWAPKQLRPLLNHRRRKLTLAALPSPRR